MLRMDIQPALVKSSGKIALSIDRHRILPVRWSRQGSSQITNAYSSAASLWSSRLLSRDSRQIEKIYASPVHLEAELAT